jgi:hypothetical protein
MRFRAGEWASADLMVCHGGFFDGQKGRPRYAVSPSPDEGHASFSRVNP